MYTNVWLLVPCYLVTPAHGVTIISRQYRFTTLWLCNLGLISQGQGEMLCPEVKGLWKTWQTASTCRHAKGANHCTISSYKTNSNSYKLHLLPRLNSYYNITSNSLKSYFVVQTGHCIFWTLCPFLISSISSISHHLDMNQGTVTCKNILQSDGKKEKTATISPEWNWIL